ncbi:pectinesterase family protein [Cohnella fermenti]|uniref:Pectinesterase n=1 Tax=Cohnella fermenti TaxID=2565925 RepID=A0A4S4C707_9BACL|nr:pectinesterase family protein [Cohnella fermenti]THF83436.1 pectin methylesterase [Cohnella fermenti]
MASLRKITVAKDGSGQHRTIQEAVDSIPRESAGRVVIEVKAGEYREKLVIDRPDVSLIGEGADRTTVVWGDYARKAFPSGEPYYTFHSYTALIGGDGFVCEGVSFVNDAGPGELVGQAIAAYVDGDRVRFRNCRFVGWQDTLFTGPLPPNPLDRSTFGGPREGQPLRPSRQYYEECCITGDIDFVFGSATAVFERCELRSRGGEQPPKEAGGAAYGWVTAASTPQGAEHGYVFLRCRLTADAQVPAGSVHLGRPWRDYAKTAFVLCELGTHIARAGWQDWNGRGEAGGVAYEEFGNEGAGAAAAAAGERTSWSRRLTEAEAERLSADDVLAGSDGWRPSAEGGEVR